MSNQWKFDEDFVEHGIFEIAGLSGLLLLFSLHHFFPAFIAWKEAKTENWSYVLNQPLLENVKVELFAENIRFILASLFAEDSYTKRIFEV